MLKKLNRFIKFLIKPASIVLLVFALYELLQLNFFSALSFAMLANMLQTEARYTALKERLDAQELAR